MQSLYLASTLLLFLGIALPQGQPASSAQAYLDRGIDRAKMGDLDEAIAEYNKAIALDPGFALAYDKRAFCRALKADLDGAMADYDRAIALNPKLADAYYYRGETRKVKASRDGINSDLEALADFDKAIESDAGFAKAYYARGYMRMLKEDMVGAVADFDMVIDLKPNSNVANAYAWRGLIRLKQGKDLQAQRDFKRCFALSKELRPTIKAMADKIRRTRKLK
jgi:tetratricopeptide (TPR) repeat protein